MTVRLFAGAADLVGQRQVQLELSEPATVADLSALVGAEYASLMPLLKISRWAIDRQFVDQQTIIDSTQEIALIPPVSGG